MGVDVVFGHLGEAPHPYAGYCEKNRTAIEHLARIATAMSELGYSMSSPREAAPSRNARCSFAYEGRMQTDSLKNKGRGVKLVPYGEEVWLTDEKGRAAIFLADETMVVEAAQIVAGDSRVEDSPALLSHGEVPRVHRRIWFGYLDQAREGLGY